MSKVTTDPNHPDLTRGGDKSPTPQAPVYLVLSENERNKGFVRPYRDAYRHGACLSITTMSRSIAETYAREPGFYGATYCLKCRKHLPVSEFQWYEIDGSIGPVVGT